MSNPFKAYEETIAQLHQRIKTLEDGMTVMLQVTNELRGQQYARASAFPGGGEGSGEAGAAVQQVNVSGNGGLDEGGGDIYADQNKRETIVEYPLPEGDATLVVDAAGKEAYFANLAFPFETRLCLNGDVRIFDSITGKTAQLAFVRKTFTEAVLGDGKKTIACVVSVLA